MYSAVSSLVLLMTHIFIHRVVYRILKSLYSVIKPPEWQVFGPVCMKTAAKGSTELLLIVPHSTRTHTHKPIPHPALSPPFNGLIFNIPLLQQGHGNTRGKHYRYPEGGLASSSGYRGVSLLSLSGSFSE